MPEAIFPRVPLAGRLPFAAVGGLALWMNAGLAHGQTTDAVGAGRVAEVGVETRSEPGESVEGPEEPADPLPPELADLLRKAAESAESAGGPSAESEIAPALRAVLEAEHLTDEERRGLRLEHGLWTEADLLTAGDRAAAALDAGAVSAGAFDDPGVPAVLRAGGLLGRGRAAEALALLDGTEGIEAAELRSRALFDLGRFEEADAAVGPVVERMLAEPVENPAELAAGVRALLLRSVIREPTRAGGDDFRTIMRLIENGRDNIDRLSWRLRVVEAGLLYDKHNRQDAATAAAEALALNPRSAEALSILGRLAVDGFAFAEAERAAARLDEIAGEFGVPSAEAAMLRARMRLRQRDADAAAAILREIRDELPEHRGLLALDAAAAAAGFDDARRARLLDEYEGLAPGSPLAAFEVGSTLAEARQYDDASQTLRAAAEGPLAGWSQPWIELGLVLIQAGRDGEAEPALARASALDPFNARARNSLELVRGLEEFDTLESDHFVVRFMPGVDALLAGEMLPVLESIHDRVTADPADIPGGIGHEPDRKTLIELMPSHSWFSVRITGMTRVHTMAAATGPVIAMESPQEGPGFTVGPFDWPRVIQHEYTHTVTLSKTRNRIPHWFTEALAVFNEDGPRDERTWRLLAQAYETGSLFDLAKINTAFVRPEKPTDRAQAYAQGHWMVEYMVERFGADAPVRLMRRYAEGEREASAFEAEFGIPAGEFMSGFTAWAAADLRRAGLLPDADAPTVPEMLEADRREAEDPASVRPDLAFVARWREQHPDHPQLAELAVSLLMARDADGDDARLGDDLLGELGTLVRVLPVAETPHRLLARHHLARETPTDAIPHLEFLDAREQNSAVYATELARLYAAAGDLAASRAKAERAARIAPFDADVREFAARVALAAAIGPVAGAGGDIVERSEAFAQAERHVRALTVIEPGIARHQARLERLRQLAQSERDG